MALSVTLNLQATMIRLSKLLATADNSARCYSSISIKIMNGSGQMLVMFRLLAQYMMTMPFSFSMSVTSKQ